MTTTALRVGQRQPDQDLVAAELAAATFLTALGVDLASGGLAETPARMARAYAELLSPREFAFTTFANDEGYDELVVTRDIAIRSVCEHHLLPFVGVAHVGYLPGDRIVGLSKLARVVHLFAHGPQLQERLTRQIAVWPTPTCGTAPSGSSSKPNTCARPCGAYRPPASAASPPRSSDVCATALAPARSS
jgi:GTP cyclohydrolase IA